MDTPVRKFAPLWSKYRPAILKMMIEAAEKPQRYQLTAHDLASMEGKKQGRVDFSMQVSRQKPVNSIKDSAIAQDLLNMLTGSPKGNELLAVHDYEIVLDKQLVLHVSRLDTKPN